MMARPFPPHPGTGPAPSADQVEWLIDRERAFHLISAHADPMAICRSEADNDDQHDHEHTGPGTIRNHPRDWLGWDAAKIEAILEEAEAAR
jgi:hypothetical protein